MDFNEVIGRIMPEVWEGSTAPFIIYRDKSGEWNREFTNDQYGKTYDWVVDIKETDPYTVTLYGANFAQGSFPYVYDKVFAARLRAECEATPYGEGAIVEFRAIINFFEDYAGNLSSDVTEYLTTLDRPLYTLYEMKPFSIKDEKSDFGYDEDKVDDFIEVIENYVEKVLEERENEKPVENTVEKNGVMGYTELQSVQIAGWRVVLAENPAKPEPYMVCTCGRDNPFSAEANEGISTTNDYFKAMREFTERVTGFMEFLETERQASGLPFQTLTVADCVKDSNNNDYEGKLVIIKPEALTNK